MLSISSSETCHLSGDQELEMDDQPTVPMDTETQSEVNYKKLVVENNDELVADSEKTEEWEEELDDTIRGTTAEIRDWKTLHDQIKDELKKKHKALFLAQVNQLIILSNFTTLHLKGISHISVSVEIAQQ